MTTIGGSSHSSCVPTGH